MNSTARSIVVSLVICAAAAAAHAEGLSAECQAPPPSWMDDLSALPASPEAIMVSAKGSEKRTAAPGPELEEPEVNVVFGDNHPNWMPPPCSGWQPRPFTVAVEIAGDTKITGGEDEILERFAHVSDFTTIRYWSATGEQWGELVMQATAVTSPAADDLREDFTVEELLRGPVYFRQHENTPFEDVVYRIEVVHADPNRVIVTLENARTVDAPIVDEVAPGEHQFVFSYERNGDGHWTLYSLMRSGDEPSTLARLARKSVANRAVAVFRHLAGVETDGPPPLFP